MRLESWIKIFAPLVLMATFLKLHHFVDTFLSPNDDEMKKNKSYNDGLWRMSSFVTTSPRFAMNLNYTTQKKIVKSLVSEFQKFHKFPHDFIWGNFSNKMKNPIKKNEGYYTQEKKLKSTRVFYKKMEKHG